MLSHHRGDLPAARRRDGRGRHAAGGGDHAGRARAVARAGCAPRSTLEQGLATRWTGNDSDGDDGGAVTRPDQRQTIARPPSRRSTWSGSGSGPHLDGGPALAGRPDQAGDRGQRAGPQHPGLRRRRARHGGGGQSPDGRTGVQLVLHRRRARHRRPRPGADRRLDVRQRAGPRAVRRAAAGRRVRAGLRARHRAPASWSSSGRGEPGARRPGTQETCAGCGSRTRARPPPCRSAAASWPAGCGSPRPGPPSSTLAVTEAATNLHRHAADGALLLRIAREASRPGIELVAIDPGRASATPARRCVTATPPAGPWASASAPSSGSPTSTTCTRCPVAAPRW